MIYTGIGAHYIQYANPGMIIVNDVCAVNVEHCAKMCLLNAGIQVCKINGIICPCPSIV